jgi:hypothetical protein
MLLLTILGEPWRAALYKKINTFKNLDLLQTVTLDIYLGAMALYFLALLPLGLFDKKFLQILTILSFASILFLHRKTLLTIKKRKFNLTTHIKEKKNTFLEALAVFSMFLIILCIQLLAISNYIFGSIHDTSLHSLFVELIIENKQLPSTHQPYLPSAIIYPQGAHPIFAYACHMLELDPPRSVFYISSLFIAIAVLGAYFFGKKALNKHFGIHFSFIIGFISMWPMFITWGSNPFIIGFGLFFICLAILPTMPEILTNTHLIGIICIGLLYGFTGAIHLAFVEVLILTIILWLLSSSFLGKIRKMPVKKHIFLHFTLMLIFTALTISPYLYRFIKYANYPGQNIGLPSDIVPDSSTPPTTSIEPLQPSLIAVLKELPYTTLFHPNIHPYPALRVLWSSLLFCSLFILFWHLRKKSLNKAESIALASAVSCILLFLVTTLWPISVIPWGRISFLLYVALCLLFTSFNLWFWNLLKKNDILRLKKKINKYSLGGLITAILLFSSIYGPFVYARITMDVDTLSSNYGIFAVTTEDDYKLMIWIKNNLDSNACILTSPYEAGLFIPSISQKRIVYPFSGHWLSASYRRLIKLVELKVLNQTTLDLMKWHNITHIYVGANAAYQWWWIEKKPGWDPQFFMAHNETFSLTAQFGNAYLFQIHYRNDCSLQGSAKND